MVDSQFFFISQSQFCFLDNYGKGRKKPEVRAKLVENSLGNLFLLNLIETVHKTEQKTCHCHRSWGPFLRGLHMIEKLNHLQKIHSNVPALRFRNQLRTANRDFSKNISRRECLNVTNINFQCGCLLSQAAACDGQI